jgi:transcriptional regulator with XRE-family HTH domain
MRAQLAITPSELAERMREKRTANGLTMQQAAAEAGVSAATFSRVSRGDHVPDFILLPHNSCTRTMKLDI